MKCCVPKDIVSDQKAICKRCSHKAKSVGIITLYHWLQNQFLKSIRIDVAYFFCESQNCQVVYFSNETDQYYSIRDVRNRIGIKESDSPIQVCYCFDYTEESIRDQIEQTGSSTAAEDITAKIQSKLCSCEVRNPSGKCCLGNVKAAIKKITVSLSVQK